MSSHWPLQRNLLQGQWLGVRPTHGDAGDGSRPH
jgi:hypothetical protein